MTIEPKEVNKVVDRAKMKTSKKPARQPVKSLKDLPIVKKKLEAADKKLTAMKKASQAVVVAARGLAKLCETKKARR